LLTAITTTEEIPMNLIARSSRILEDATHRRVVVETIRKRNISKPTMADHAVAAGVSQSQIAQNAPISADARRVMDLVSQGAFEGAAKLAAKIINSGLASNLFSFHGTREFELVDAWVERQLKDGVHSKISQFCELTPELAQILLSKNDGNRRINSANLSAIMRDMSSGRWAPNGETIIISKDGLLNDGQHRCFAALLTNSCVETAVAFGVDRASMATVDIGRKRTGADRLGIGGVPNYVAMSAISNLILQMKNKRAATAAETDAFFSEHQELITLAHSAAGSNMKGIGPSVAGAACAYLLSVGHKQASISTFFAGVRSGEMMPKRDPRMLLHKAIFDARYKVKLTKENWVRAFVAHYIAHQNAKMMSSVVFDITLDWGI